MISILLPLALAVLLLFTAAVFRSRSSRKAKELSQRETKLRKLKIITGELADSNDIKEKQMALRMLGGFLNDPDFRVKAGALKILCMIDPVRAAAAIEEMVSGGSENLMKEIYALIEDCGSRRKTEILFRLAGSRRENVKRAALKSLVGITEDPETPAELREIVDNKIKKVSEAEGWVLA